MMAGQRPYRSLDLTVLPLRALAGKTAMAVVEEDTAEEVAVVATAVVAEDMEVEDMVAEEDHTVVAVATTREVEAAATAVEDTTRVEEVATSRVDMEEEDTRRGYLPYIPPLFAEATTCAVAYVQSSGCAS